MFIDKFYNTTDGKVVFSRQQASDFAKNIADDFNPLHDIDAKRFCVPGDLLFSIALSKAGLHQQMGFRFSGMVTDGIELNFPEKIDGKAAISDDNEKTYVEIEASGDVTTNDGLISSLIKSYVEFSGHTFPHILVKLMAEKNVMINPARPMVMYEDMAIHLEHFDIPEVALEFSESTLTIDGKRGSASLAFNLTYQGNIVGHGKKHMLLSGLREYCPEVMSAVVEEYNKQKAEYFAK